MSQRQKAAAAWKRTFTARERLRRAEAKRDDRAARRALEDLADARRDAEHWQSVVNEDRGF